MTQPVEHYKYLGVWISKHVESDFCIITLIQNYLAERHQRVVLNGASSQPARVTLGVSQRSILGPLLFLIYRPLQYDSLFLILPPAYSRDKNKKH